MLHIMNIFVTGASGFVGGAATRELVAQGHRVRAMSRNAASDQLISELGAEPVRCDLESVRAEQLGEPDLVLHCAAYVEPWGAEDAWYRGNVIGTRAILEAARHAGVGRFIHIGTEAALVRGQHLFDADETYDLAPDSPFPYCATKAQAERLVLSANAADFTTMVLRPRLIWGPGDTTLLPAIENMSDNGGWMWIDHGRALTSSTHINNLVHAIVLALTRGEPGAAYFVLDDGVHTIKYMVSGMAAAKNIGLLERSMPAWLADRAGALCEGIWRSFRLQGAPPLTRHAAMVMSRNCVLDDSRARAQLGYAPVITVEQGMQLLRAG
jgi:nucleoside-diphosphate-sugar epimerase